MPSNPPRPSSRRRWPALLCLALTGGVLVTGVPAAQAAAGTAFNPPYPTVYISQVPAGGTADIKAATQSRLANSGTGGVTISTLGNAGVALNAIGYRAADNYVYAMATSGDHLLKVGAAGGATDLGAVTGLPAGPYYAATFGGPSGDTFYVSALASNTLYGIDVATRAVVSTLTLSKTVYVADYTASDGYLWGISATAGTTPAVDPTLVRIAQDGTVTSIPTTGVLNQTERGSYGAAWRYGNGNLAFSYNTTGQITQIKVNDPASATPTATLVSAIAGPSTSSNDGTTSPSEPADLRLSVTGPAAAGPGDPLSWRVTVSSGGPGGSSGGTFRFAVPADVTSLTVPPGCQVTGGVVQCVVGQLAAGANDFYDFSATAGPTFSVPRTSTITLVGNEADPDGSNDTATLTVTPTTQTLATTGTGTTPQSTTVRKPSGAAVHLVDNGTQVDTVLVPDEGTYTVDPTSGVATFTPLLGFAGPASPVTFVIVPTSGATATGSYTAAVTPPAAPTATDRTSTGVGNALQHTTVPVPTEGTVTLVDPDGTPTTSVTTADGGYTLDPATGEITFAPAALFTGDATPVRFRVSDAYEQDSDVATYTPSVSAPPVPSPGPLATTGPLDAAQHTGTVPGTQLALVGPDGTDVSVLAVSGGTYEVAGHTLGFTPDSCFVGTAADVTYRVTDEYGQSGTAAYQATVIDPAPTASALTSTGTAPDAQSVSVTLTDCTSVTLLDDLGDPATTVERPGEGTYTSEGATLTFTPVHGYSGSPLGVGYRIEGPAASADSTYSPTVTAPAAPDAGPRWSTGEGATPQDAMLPVPAGGTVTLLDASGDEVSELVVPGVGTYVLDATAGTVAFVPESGFSGTPAAVSYQVTDIYGQTATSTYTPSVVKPAPPTAGPLASTGAQGVAQSRQVAVPTGDTVRLLDAVGDAVTSVEVTGEGDYVLDTATGVITFQPLPGFSGEAMGVEFRVTDAYGQSAVARYRPVVTAVAAPVPAGRARVAAPDLVRSATRVPATCSVQPGEVRACTVTAFSRVSGHRVVVGTGRARVDTSTGVPSLRVPIRLNRLGKALAQRPHGVPLALTAVVRRAGVAGTQYADTRSQAVAPRVALHPVYFDTDSARVRPGDRRYLQQVRARLADVRSVTCTGFTDSRSTSSYNRALAERRAASTCAVLTRGREVRVVLVTRGETRPVGSNASAHGRQLNRRAEVVLHY